MKAQLLVVEDEPTVRQNLTELLEAEAFVVQSAANGAEALGILERFVPDLVICDVMMPVMDGHTFLRRIQEQPHLAGIPFIFLTAKVDPTDLREGLNLGADDYLTKPFTRDQLLHAVRLRIRKQEAVDAKFSKQLESLRSNISGSLPHELRTPLTGIIGFAEFLLEDLENIPPADVRQYVTYILQSGKRLHRLIENYVTYSDLQVRKIRGWNLGQRPVGDRDISVLEVLTQVAQTVAYEFDRPDDLIIQVEDVGIRVPEKEFERLFAEVIDNAFRYSQPDQLVRVSAKTEEGTLVTTIMDNGIGFTREQLGAIGAFMQFDRGKHEQQGSGLGLVIARELAELHNGSLHITSSEGVGTTVVVRLPLG